MAINSSDNQHTTNTQPHTMSYRFTIIITGPAASGKSTLIKSLQSKGFKAAKLYTTRPSRSEEDKEYWFINDRQFNAEFINEPFKHQYNGWWYVLTIYAYFYNDVFALGPHMTRQVIDFLKANSLPYMVIYCTAARETRYKRMIERGDDYAEVIRRLGADDRDFADFTEYDIKHVTD